MGRPDCSGLRRHQQGSQRGAGEEDQCSVFLQSDRPGTDWHLDLKNGAGSCGQGESPAAVDASFKMSSANFGKMFAGKLKPTAAFMTGRKKIEGNMGKAMKLEKLMGQMQKRGYHTVGNSKL